PEQIPFDFHYQLSLEYAVGRIYFETVDEYARYAANVVLSETGEWHPPARAVFFGTETEGDPSTKRSAQQLVRPLAERVKASDVAANWQIDTYVGKGQADKAQLLNLLGGDETPALLFTASHGMGFELNDPRLLWHQGALLCQDWEGPASNRVPQTAYVAADDITENANLLGTIAFHFACFGAATPKLDNYPKANGHRKQLAPRSFLSALPLKLLSQGALAVIGHSDRAWATSFIEHSRPQLGVFQSPLQQMMSAMPIGYATEYIDNRWAALATELLFKQQNGGQDASPRRLIRDWSRLTDARNYMILGDPAVRLQVSDSAENPPTHRRRQPLTLNLSSPQSPASDANTVSQVDNTVTTVTNQTGGIDIKTYVADDLEALQFENGQFTGSPAPTLQARTHIAQDGSLTSVVASEHNARLWQIHLDLIKQAQSRQP
ncbi:MAG: C25 family cysteine peptidase, partial [Candidatus Promineifilaceae bacterium]